MTRGEENIKKTQQDCLFVSCATIQRESGPPHARVVLDHTQ